MNYELRIKLLIVAILVATTGVYAQKYPERRTTRQGTALYNKGDYTGAEAEYRRALELNPELREAAFNLGGALWRQAQTAAQPGQDEQQQKAIQDRAVEATEAWMAIAVDSLAPTTMASAAGYNAGNVALAAQQLDAAIEAYKQSLRLRPDDMEAKFNLAYAQKMKQQQEDQNDDQNNDDQQDGGGNDQNDQNDQNDDQNDGDQDGDGQNDPQDGDGNDDDNNGDGDQDGNEPPPPSGEGKGKPKMDPRAAEQILDAMQAAEDDTREKVNAREVQTGARSGKNW